MSTAEAGHFWLKPTYSAVRMPSPLRFFRRRSLITRLIGRLWRLIGLIRAFFSHLRKSLTRLLKDRIGFQKPGQTSQDHIAIDWI